MNSFRFFWRLIDLKLRLYACIALILSVLSSLSEIYLFSLIPVLVKVFTSVNQPLPLLGDNKVNLHPIWESKGDFILFFVFVCVLVGIARVASLASNMDFSARVTTFIGQKTYQSFLRASPNTSLTNTGSKIIVSFTVYLTEFTNYLASLMQIISNGILMISIIAFLLASYPLQALYTIAPVGILYVLINLCFRPRLTRNSLIISDSTEQLTQHIRDSLETIREINIYKLYQHQENTYTNIDRKLRSTLRDTWVIAGMPRYIIETFALILISLLSFLTFKSTLSTEGSIASIAIILVILQRCLPLAQQIYGSIVIMKTYSQSVSRLKMIFNSYTEKPVFTLTTNSHNDSPMMAQLLVNDGINNNTNKALLRLDSISFSYDPGRPVFASINKQFYRGDRIALVGKSGSGKSTLLDIISGLLRPTSGDIRFQGKSIFNKPDNINAYHKDLAFVSQQPYILPGRLCDNVTLSDPSLNNKDLLYSCLELASCFEFMESFPDGIYTDLSKTGIRLSGGQAQRIAIARSLYRQPRILVLDEATSALDTATEAKVLNAITMLQRIEIVILVTHRTTTVSTFATHIWEPFA